MTTRKNQPRHDLLLRLTQDERQALDAAAAKAGVPTSTWVRAVALRTAGAPPHVDGRVRKTVVLDEEVAGA
jgi:uncharacterized protein (DUF1778 family)